MRRTNRAMRAVRKTRKILAIRQAPLTSSCEMSLPPLKSGMTQVSKTISKTRIRSSAPAEGRNLFPWRGQGTKMNQPSSSIL